MHDRYLCEPDGVLYLSPHPNMKYMVKSIPTIPHYKLQYVVLNKSYTDIGIYVYQK